MNSFRLSNQSSLGDMSYNGQPVRIWLLSADERNKKTVYRIVGRFPQTGQTWEIYRRYSEFLALRNQLVRALFSPQSQCPGCRNYLKALENFDFPKKHFFHKTTVVINYRIRALRSFLKLIVTWAFSNTPKCPNCGGLPFTLAKNFLLNDGECTDGSDMESIRDSLNAEMFSTPYGSFRNSSSSISTPSPSMDLMKSGQGLHSVSRFQTPAFDDPVPKELPSEDPYEGFNDYLLKNPKKGTAAEIANRQVSRVGNESFISDTQSQSARKRVNDSFISDYNQEEERETASSRQRLNDSFLSDCQSGRGGGDAAFGSHRTNESVISLTEEEMAEVKLNGEKVSRVPAAGPVEGGAKNSKEEILHDEDELDTTGIPYAEPVQSNLQKKEHTNLWQSWELAPAS